MPHAVVVQDERGTSEENKRFGEVPENRDGCMLYQRVDFCPLASEPLVFVLRNLPCDVHEPDYIIFPFIDTYVVLWIYIMSYIPVLRHLCRFKRMRFPDWGSD